MLDEMEVQGQSGEEHSDDAGDFLQDHCEGAQWCDDEVEHERQHQDDRGQCQADQWEDQIHGCPS